jgi:hypothetical protein
MTASEGNRADVVVRNADVHTLDPALPRAEGFAVRDGSVISPVFQSLGSRETLAALDEASLGRPVLLRDDSLHNRWVNTRALDVVEASAGPGRKPSAG